MDLFFFLFSSMADPESVLKPPVKEEKKRNESPLPAHEAVRQLAEQEPVASYHKDCPQILVVVNYRDDVHEYVGMSEIIAMPGTTEPRNDNVRKRERRLGKSMMGANIAHDPVTGIQALRDLGMDADIVLGHRKLRTFLIQDRQKSKGMMISSGSTSV